MIADEALRHVSAPRRQRVQQRLVGLHIVDHLGSNARLGVKSGSMVSRAFGRAGAAEGIVVSRYFTGGPASMTIRKGKISMRVPQWVWKVQMLTRFAVSSPLRKITQPVLGHDQHVSTWIFADPAEVKGSLRR